MQGHFIETHQGFRDFRASDLHLGCEVSIESKKLQFTFSVPLTCHSRLLQTVFGGDTREIGKKEDTVWRSCSGSHLLQSLVRSVNGADFSGC